MSDAVSDAMSDAMSKRVECGIGGRCRINSEKAGITKAQERGNERVCLGWMLKRVGDDNTRRKKEGFEARRGS